MSAPAKQPAAAAATPAAAPAPKTQKAIFVEDIAQYVVDKTPTFPDNCSWTAEVIQMCMLKAANFQNSKIVFRSVDTNEVIPVVFATCFDARRKNSKHSEHTYNTLFVKVNNSQFAKAAPKLNYATAPAEDAAKVDEGANCVGGGDAGAALRSLMTGKKFDVCCATLDRTITIYKKDGKSDDKPGEQVVAGLGRLDLAKFNVDKGNFYDVVSLNPSHVAQRQIAINEYIVGHSILLASLGNGTQPKKDKDDELTYVMGKNKFKVSATFEQRMDKEREHFSPRDINANVKTFQRMLKMLDDFNPQAFLKETTIQ